MISVMLSLLLLSNQEVVEIEKCDENNLFLSINDQLIEADFFNLIFYSAEKRNTLCEYLLKAEKVSVIKDKQSSSQEVVGYYLFADDKLVQETAIQKKLARIAVRSPEYLYAERMKKAEEKIESVMVSEKISHNRYNYRFILLLIGMILLLLMLIKII